MATSRPNTAKKSITRDKLISTYMEYVLENETFPGTAYKFCKDVKLQEQAFYDHFGSTSALRDAIWTVFFDHTLELIHKAEGYEQMSNKDKMLTLYYTFFELLTANRSYALFSLDHGKDPMEKMKQLKGLRSRLKEFATGLIEEANDEKQLKILKHPAKIFAEGAWLQMVFILKYWKEDGSAGFEKTDMVIEKSVRAVFDVFDTTPLESVVDFGKFLWKEHMN